MINLNTKSFLDLMGYLPRKPMTIFSGSVDLDMSPMKYSFVGVNNGEEDPRKFSSTTTFIVESTPGANKSADFYIMGLNQRCEVVPGASRAADYFNKLTYYTVHSDDVAQAGITKDDISLMVQEQRISQEVKLFEHTFSESERLEDAFSMEHRKEDELVVGSRIMFSNLFKELAKYPHYVARIVLNDLLNPKLIDHLPIEGEMFTRGKLEGYKTSLTSEIQDNDTHKIFLEKLLSNIINVKEIFDSRSDSDRWQVSGCLQQSRLCEIVTLLNSVKSSLVLPKSVNEILNLERRKANSSTGGRSLPREVKNKHLYDCLALIGEVVRSIAPKSFFAKDSYTS